MRVHFIAIGGTIMHNLAIALASKGSIVSGSDDHIYEPSRTNLKNNGLLPPFLGWDADKITPDIDAVVIGMHAKADNPELIRAQELGIRIFSFPEFVYEQAKEKTRVVIAGSHGKTTVTSMVMHVLKAVGADFDYLVGARLEEFDSMVKLTKDAPLMIIEGDEYLTSPVDKRPKFHHYKPNIALITGIAWDHIDVFPTFELYVDQFRTFIEGISPKGTLVYNKEDKVLQELVLADHTKINKHGYRTPEHTINKGITSIGTPAGETELQIFGKHNLSNLAAAYTVCDWLGIKRDDFYQAIKQYKGASRRLEYVASDDHGSVVYQDFAQSPSKLQASVLAVKEQFEEQELVAIIELHTQSSLNIDYLQGFKDAIALADYPVVFINTDTLKLKNANPIDEEILKIAFNQQNLVYLNTTDRLIEYVENMSSINKNLLFMSSGNYGGISMVNLAQKFFK